MDYQILELAKNITGYSSLEKQFPDFFKSSRTESGFKILNHIREELIELGIEKVTHEEDGSGDDLQYSKLELHYQEDAKISNLQKGQKKDIEVMLRSIFDRCFIDDGYYNGPGGRYEISWDLQKNEIEIDETEYVEDSEFNSYEYDVTTGDRILPEAEGEIEIEVDYSIPILQTISLPKKISIQNIGIRNDKLVITTPNGTELNYPLEFPKVEDSIRRFNKIMATKDGNTIYSR